MKILSGDVGGTNTRLALFERQDLRLRLVREERYPSAEYDSLEGIVREFLVDPASRCEHACFGIPGPVRDGAARTTNLPWVVDSRDLSARLGIGRVSLLNDLEAHAHGIGELSDADLAVLSEGDAAEGNAALMAPGTGLGQAGLFWDGKRHRPFPSEGGHCSFAPSPREENDVHLMAFLAKRFGGHVSWERVLSGPGLVNIHEFLLDLHGSTKPEWLDAEMAAGDPAAAISAAALEGRCAVCVEALDMFVRFFASEAGNLALKVMAVSGIYIGGGIAPKILGKLREPAFMRALTDKGRRRSLLETMPVRVITNDRSGLLGAARFALDAAGTPGGRTT